MMLSEESGVPQSALEVTVFRDHLRMGSGFSDDAVQDGLLETYLRAALAAIEGRTGKAILSRAFRLTVDCWSGIGRQPIPVAPVTSIQSVTLFDALGVPSTVDAAVYQLVQDRDFPVLAATGISLPPIPAGGRAEVVLEAGFGAAMASVPQDLSQAVRLLAAHYHENRHAAGEGARTIPYGVGALIERWRGLRFGRGLA
jgi:uncharacterized phiE125 gp8 family phage protein